MSKVQYSSFFDCASGMGEAARNIISALYMSGVDLTTELIPNITSKVNLGTAYDIAKSLQSKSSTYKFKIIHVTPDLLVKYLEPLKYHIFHLFWETDKLPKLWVWNLNLCDEIWTGDERMASIMRASGVKRHIWVCPQPVDTSITQADKLKIRDHKGFLFYSIFQWIERKNPKALVEAYWREFENQTDDVGLLLKVYREFFTMGEGLAIQQEIHSWKKEIKLSHYAPIYIYPLSLDKKDVFRIHATGDCFVTTHRGEGWGIPIAEALIMGKPVISIKLGGVTEYIPDTIGYFPSYTMKNVFGMDFVPWYDHSQKWGDVDIPDLRLKLRYAYENRVENKKRGELGQKFILDNFSYLAVGNKMKDRLDAIEKEEIK